MFLDNINNKDTLFLCYIFTMAVSGVYLRKRTEIFVGDKKKFSVTLRHYFDQSRTNNFRLITEHKQNLYDNTNQLLLANPTSLRTIHQTGLSRDEEDEETTLSVTV